MFTTFDKYTSDELAECGVAFQRALVDAAAYISWAETEAWTEFVLDWFTATAPNGVLVDARAPRPCSRKLPQRNTYGEFLVDLTHTTYPLYPPQGKHPYGSALYWTTALKQPCCVRLALESEWGRCGAPAVTRIEVLRDAIKVAAMRADAKVIVFGPDNATHGDRLFCDLDTLRKQSCDPSPWLCVSLPWSDEPPVAKLYKPGANSSVF